MRFSEVEWVLHFLIHSYPIKTNSPRSLNKQKLVFKDLHMVSRMQAIKSRLPPEDVIDLNSPEWIEPGWVIWAPDTLFSEWHWTVYWTFSWFLHDSITHINAFISFFITKQEFFLPTGTKLTWVSNYNRQWHHLRVDIAIVALGRMGQNIPYTQFSPMLPSAILSLSSFIEEMWMWSLGEGSHGMLSLSPGQLRRTNSITA